LLQAASPPMAQGCRVRLTRPSAEETVETGADFRFQGAHQCFDKYEEVALYDLVFARPTAFGWISKIERGPKRCIGYVTLTL